MIDFALSPTRMIFADSLAVINETSAHWETLDHMGQLIADSVMNGGKLMVCGNGGSAADADHLVAEFLIRLNPEVNRPAIPAINLAMSAATITAHANDYEYDTIFTRLILSLAAPNDVLLVISTSGNSPNVIHALEAARDLNIMCMGLLGSQGGNALPYCDIALVVPSTDTGRIQETHGVCIHALAQYVETEWLKKSPSR